MTRAVVVRARSVVALLNVLDRHELAALLRQFDFRENWPVCGVAGRVPRESPTNPPSKSRDRVAPNNNAGRAEHEA